MQEIATNSDLSQIGDEETPLHLLKSKLPGFKTSQRKARPRREKRLKSVNGGIIPLSRIVPLEYIQN